MPIALACHKGIGPAVTGTALVAQDNFSAVELAFVLFAVEFVFVRLPHSQRRARKRSKPKNAYDGRSF